MEGAKLKPDPAAIIARLSTRTASPDSSERTESSATKMAQWRPESVMLINGSRSFGLRSAPTPLEGNHPKPFPVFQYGAVRHDLRNIGHLSDSPAVADGNPPGIRHGNDDAGALC